MIHGDVYIELSCNIQGNEHCCLGLHKGGDEAQKAPTTFGHVWPIKRHSRVARGRGECRRVPRADWSAQMGHCRSLLSSLKHSAQLQLPLQLPEAGKLPDCLPHRLKVSLQMFTS